MTVIQSDNYGPWTTTPHPRREVDLQYNQARLLGHLATLVGSHGGYMFDFGGDHFIGVTNGMDIDDLRRVQRSVNNTFPYTVSIATYAARTPAEAVIQTSRAIQSEGSAQDSDRTEVLKGTCASEESIVQIAHFDIVDVTGKLTDTTNVFTARVQVKEWALPLQKYLWDAYGAVTTFVGGDNAIAVMPQMDTKSYQDILDHMEDETGYRTRVGVGTGYTAENAGLEAKYALEEGREEHRQVVAPSLTGDEPAEFTHQPEP